MNIFTKAFTPPQELETKRFVLFPTDTDYYQSDFEAVMSSREYLRVWSQSSWPEDTFTPEQNREDLRQHVDDNLTHEAYGYMIYSLDRKTCYGSLYVNPVAPVANNYKTTEAQREIIAVNDGRVDCWTAPAIESDLEIHIISEIRTWLSSEWKIKALFTARKGMDQRIQIYDQLGMSLVGDLQSATSDMRLLIFD